MEEISLMEIIQMILKGKWIIAIVTLVFMIGSVITSVFILDPIYESQTMLMISPITNVSAKEADNDFTELVSSLSQYPQMTIDTYREQVKAPVILEYLRKELGMEEASLSSIADKISVNAIEKTNLITISAKDKNPEEAAKIANLVSKKFTEFVSETSKKQAESSAKFIKEQMEKEKENMEESSEKLKEFLAKPRGPAELKLELNSKLEQITDFKTNIAQLKIDESTTRESLARGQALLKSTPKTLITSKTLINDDLLSGILKDEMELGTQDIAQLKLNDEQINGVYISLTNKVNEFEIQLSSLIAQIDNLNKKITERQKEIEVLQSELATKQQEYDLLQHEMDLNKQTYDAYQQKYKEAMIKQSAEIGESSIVIVSDAIAPVNPVEPRKSIIVVISTFLGIMISIGFVFFREYWIRNLEIAEGKT